MRSSRALGPTNAVTNFDVLDWDPLYDSRAEAPDEQLVERARGGSFGASHTASSALTALTRATTPAHGRDGSTTDKSSPPRSARWARATATVESIGGWN